MIFNLITSFCGRIKESFSRISQDDKGIGVVEVILILVVLIGLVVIFRDQLTTIVNGIFERISEDANAI